MQTFEGIKLVKKITLQKKNKKTVVLCHGVFDLLHIGHIKHLQKAKRLGDILVVNKGDRPGADRVARELQMMLSLGEEKNWVPPIVTTTATEGKGFTQLWKEINNHKKYLGEEKRNEMRLNRINYELEKQVSQKLFDEKISRIGKTEIPDVAKEILERKTDPYTAVDKIIRE